MCDASILIQIIKVCLLLINLALLGFGSGALGVGFGLRYDRAETLRLALPMSGLSDNAQSHVRAAANVDSLALAVSNALCGVGGVSLLIGAFGFFGAFCGKASLLRCYLFLLTIVAILLAALVVTVYLLKDIFTDLIGNELFDLQSAHYLPSMTNSSRKSKNFTNKIGVTHIINSIHIWFECCGMKQRGDAVNGSSWNSSDQSWEGQQLVRPYTCCKLANSRIKIKVLNRRFNLHEQLIDYLKQPDCPFLSDSERLEVHTQKCPEAIIDYFWKYKIPAVVFASILIGAQVVAVALGCWMMKLLDEDEDEDYEYDEDDW